MDRVDKYINSYADRAQKKVGWANSIQALINDIEQESPGMIDANKLAAYIALNRFNTLEPNNTVWETLFPKYF